MTGAALRPALWMADVFGPGHVYAPRAHDQASYWLPPDLDALTGGQLTILGDMPAVSSAGATTPAAIDLLALAGLDIGRRITTFRAGEAHEATVKGAADNEMKLVLQHAFPDDSWESTRCWVEPQLLRRLNRKDNLGAIVAAAAIPARKVVDRADYFASLVAAPIVIKAVTEQSSAGGHGVMICRTEADMQHAAGKFAPCERIVVEELLDAARSPCLNFAVMPDGGVRYLGQADQDVAPDGRFRGNWLKLGESLSEWMVDPALEAVKRAAAMGYRGFAGVDLAITPDDRVYVLDLNFRLNASTPAVLFAPELHRRLGEVTMHFRTLRGSGSGLELAQALTPLVESGRIIPFSLFDPAAAGYLGKAPLSQALIVGESRPDVLAVEEELARAGLG